MISWCSWSLVESLAWQENGLSRFGGRLKTPTLPQRILVRSQPCCRSLREHLESHIGVGLLLCLVHGIAIASACGTLTARTTRRAFPITIGVESILIEELGPSQR